MTTRHMYNRPTISPVGAVSRFLAVALLVLVSFGPSADRAIAGKRSVGIGAGVAGALLLNELAKGTGKRKAATPRRSKRSVATRPSKPSKQRAREKSNDADDSVAASKKEPTENTPVKENITTGSTGSSRPETAAMGQGGSGIISASDEIKAAQQHLKFMGYDIPQETGAVDAKTKSAVMQFQDSIGEPVTGDLTTDQLQRLFMKAAEKRQGS